MLVRRLVALYVGLWLYGFSMAVMVRAELGLDPWDVFHQGVAKHVPLSYGTVTAITGVVALAAWVPLRQRPGLGTVSNVVVIALSVDAGLAWLPSWDSPAVRIGAMVAAVVSNAVASVLYIGAGMGPGPRDGLMTGLVRRTGKSVWVVRTAIEVSVLTTGFVLGGSIGIGTLVYAFGIGPLIHLMIPAVNRVLPWFAPPKQQPVAGDVTGVPAG
ncbi:YczE/YyaS/YitT family protein [Nocardia sp. SC052]|uniref:membrane protein YczE n=1 Tax=Nocardia sichangensis TaxID=3385975 RepID=UPI0039A10405